MDLNHDYERTGADTDFAHEAPTKDHDAGAFAGANPVELDEATASCLRPRTIEKIKHIYCENYNNCLNLAEKKDWAGFSCGKCNSYFPISRLQLAMDQMGLIAAYEASGNVHQHGNAHRKVGVKPNDYSNRNKKRLPIIAERAEGVCADMNQLRKMVIG